MNDKVAAPTIELDVGPGPRSGEYSVKVVRAAAGRMAHSTFTLDVNALANGSRSLETVVLASAARARARVVPEHEKPLREVGCQLFQALFAGPIEGTYRASRAVALDRGERLRVVLSITAPELAVMPWEALYDDELGTYICRREGLVRRIDAEFTPDPLPVRPPLRILGIVASPRGLAELDVDAEEQHLEEALAGAISSGLVLLEWEPQASWWRVQERLLQEQWHVLHFIGHGDFDPERGEGRIALVRRDDRADWKDATELADLLGQAEPTPRVVVLNSCASGQGGSQDLFSGTAATLVRSGICAVAAMQFSVSDMAAVAFPRGFYTALASGRRVDEAVTAGRVGILGLGGGTLEWVTPILHVRGEATELFQLVGSSRGPVPSAVAPAEQRRNLKKDPQWTKARAACWAKRWPEAVEHFEALKARYPDEAEVDTGLQEARRQRDIEVWSTKADAGAQEGDWDTVVTALEHLTELEPAYPEAASRLERARESQRYRWLIDEMIALHQAGQWDAVVAAAQELVRLDPENPDPDGIVSDAQAKIRERQLADRYAQAVNHLDQEEWRQAADVFTRIEQDEPGYLDAAALRATAEQQLQQLDLAHKYRGATEAQGSGDWVTATTLFDEIIAIDPGYHDAATRHQQCQHAWRVRYLQSELRRHANDGSWQSVVDLGAELARLDPTAADPDGLVERAREMLGLTLQQPPVSFVSQPRSQAAQPPAPPHGYSVLPNAGGDAQVGPPHVGSGVGALPKQAYTPWIRRVGAWIIDAVPLLFVWFIGYGIAYSTGNNVCDSQGYCATQFTGLSIFVVSVMWLLVLVYLIWNYGYRQGTTGSSIGKSVLKFKVVGEKTGQPIGFGLSFARQLAHVVDWITFCVGCLWPLWDAKRQTLADKMMSTVCLSI